MNKLILPFLVILICLSCQKANTDSVNDKTTSTDQRDKFVGTYKIYMHSHGVNAYGSPPVYYDTSYTCEMTVKYNSADSVMYNPYPTYAYMPAVSMYYSATNVLFRKLGVDNTGKVYRQYEYKTGAVGGFIPQDSINLILLDGSNHSSYSDTLRGHKL